MIKTLIFIVGVGRSGTSLLQSTLNAHKKVTSLPETQFLRKYVAKKATRDAINRSGPEAFFKLLSADDAFHRLKLPIPALSDKKSQTKFDVKDVYLSILQLTLAQKGKNVIVDKDPRLIDYLGELHESFPDATVIHIIRDPREVVLSKSKAAWSSRRPIWLNALIGEAQLANGRRLGKKLFNDRFLEIRYEDLVINPINELTRICTALNLEFDRNMLQHEKSSRELVSAAEMQWKKETLRPIIKDNTNKWQSQLSPYSVAIIESVSREAFEHLGYIKSKPQINFLQRITIAFFRLSSVFFTKLYVFAE